MIYMKKYSQHIIHQFFGHRHNDQFLLMKQNNVTLGSGFIGGSFMPDNHDPTLRIYSYNGTHIDDYQQYRINLQETIQTDQIQLEHQYSFRKLYGTGPPTTQNLDRLYSNMTKNDPLFEKYCHQYTVRQKEMCEKKELLSRIIINM